MPDNYVNVSFDQELTDDLIDIAAHHAQLVRQGGATCPNCDETTIRMYYHNWSNLFREHQVRRGAFWLWCSNCRYWVSQGNIDWADIFRLTDPFEQLEGNEFGNLDRAPDWIDRLDALWTSKEIRFVENRHLLSDAVEYIRPRLKGRLLRSVPSTE